MEPRYLILKVSNTLLAHMSLCLLPAVMPKRRMHMLCSYVPPNPPLLAVSRKCKFRRSRQPYAASACGLPSCVGVAHDPEAGLKAATLRAERRPLISV